MLAVQKEIRDHLSNLPDLTQLPDVTGGLAPLPSAGDLFNIHWILWQKKIILQTFIYEFYELCKQKKNAKCKPIHTLNKSKIILFTFKLFFGQQKWNSLLIINIYYICIYINTITIYI